MELPRYHRLIPALYRLEGTHCTICDTLSYPPLRLCHNCGSYDLHRHTFKGYGKLLTYSEMFIGPSEHTRSAPYFVGLVRLVEGVVITAQLTDIQPDKLHEGMPVEATMRRIGDVKPGGIIVYGIKFRPARRY